MRAATAREDEAMSAERFCLDDEDAVALRADDSTRSSSESERRRFLDDVVLPTTADETAEGAWPFCGRVPTSWEMAARWAARLSPRWRWSLRRSRSRSWVAWRARCCQWRACFSAAASEALSLSRSRCHSRWAFWKLARRARCSLERCSASSTKRVRSSAALVRAFSSSARSPLSGTSAVVVSGRGRLLVCSLRRAARAAVATTRSRDCVARDRARLNLSEFGSESSPEESAAKTVPTAATKRRRSSTHAVAVSAGASSAATAAATSPFWFASST
mmetsp:Transcript_27718/g.85035  ORF Transcript_27718/g.85035 Transcript_27718/m.85035 type:complete len:275 (+) Transcript_27718:164-988(+)